MALDREVRSFSGLAISPWGVAGAEQASANAPSSGRAAMRRFERVPLKVRIWVGLRGGVLV